MDSRSRDIGEKLSSLYVGLIREDRRISPEILEIPIKDINWSLTVLQLQYQAIRGFKVGYPALKINDLIIPIDIIWYFENIHSGLDEGDEYILQPAGNFSVVQENDDNRKKPNLRRYMRKFTEQKGQVFDHSPYLKYSHVNLEFNKFFHYLEFALSQFLSLRHFHRDKISYNGGQPLSVEVHTKSKGLLIQSSPAYFLSWSYFGSPSTPVHGGLHPGKYIFGGKNDSGRFDFDPTRVNIPTNTKIFLNGI